MTTNDAASAGDVIPVSGAGAAPLRLHGWSDPAVLAVALVALAAGFGQFGLTATLGGVARHFGHVVQGSTVADRAGLSGTELGLGLAIVRLASLGGLPLAGRVRPEQCYLHFHPGARPERAARRDVIGHVARP